MFLVISYGDKTVYTGPFPNERKAELYVEAIRADCPDVWRTVIQPLVLPHTSVKSIIWR